METTTFFYVKVIGKKGGARRKTFQKYAQHKYTHAAIIAKYEDGLSIIRFDYNRVAVHLLVCVFMVLIPIRFNYNAGKPCEIVVDIKFQFH